MSIDNFTFLAHHHCEECGQVLMGKKNKLFSGERLLCRSCQKKADELATHREQEM